MGEMTKTSIKYCRKCKYSYKQSQTEAADGFLRMIFFQGISTLSFQKMRRESVSCGMKTDGVRMSRAVITTRNWMILIQRILK